MEPPVASWNLIVPHAALLSLIVRHQILITVTKADNKCKEEWKNSQSLLKMILVWAITDTL